MPLIDDAFNLNVLILVPTISPILRYPVAEPNVIAATVIEDVVNDDVKNCNPMLVENEESAFPTKVVEAYPRVPRPVKLELIVTRSPAVLRKPRVPRP